MRLEHLKPEDLNLPCRIGIISDSHVDGRSNPLDPRVFQIFSESRVNAIFHLGDITDQKVIHDLARIARVYTVRGNRDLVHMASTSGCHLNGNRWIEYWPYAWAWNHAAISLGQITLCIRRLPF